MIITARSNRALVKYKPFKVLVCLVTLVAFLCNTVLFDSAWAVGTPSTLTGRGVDGAGGSGSLKELNIDTFTLPEYLGQVKETCKGGSGKIVVHIQDAHCNYAAQHKIAEIIDYFNKEYGVNALNLEGGAKDYDISIFTDIVDKAKREKAADYFVKEGLVGGAEYFAINNPEKVALWGIEDTKLYIDNLKIYRDSLKYKSEVDKHLGALAHILNNLKMKIYSPELLELDRKYSQYKAGSLEFKDYLAYLAAAAKGREIDIKSFNNIYLLGQALEEEGKVDFKKANDQRDELIDKLQKKLSKKSLEELVLKTVEFKSEKIPQKEFYAYLASKAKPVGIDMSAFPDLEKYTVYISMYDAIDKMNVMEEMDKLEAAVKSALYRNDKERELAKLSKNLAILKNIFNISLTRGDYKYYIDNERSFDTSGYMTFINREAPLYKIDARPDANIADLDGHREDISKFYKYSLKRDDVFVKNIKFGKDRKTAFMVTGGFHTENLCEKFKKEKISYISIMPNFRNDEGYECPYFNVLSGKDNVRIKDALPSVLKNSLAPPPQLCPTMEGAIAKMNEAAKGLAPAIEEPAVTPPAPTAGASVSLGGTSPNASTEVESAEQPVPEVQPPISNFSRRDFIITAAFGGLVVGAVKTIDALETARIKATRRKQLDPIKPRLNLKNGELPQKEALLALLSRPEYQGLISEDRKARLEQASMLNEDMVRDKPSLFGKRSMDELDVLWAIYFLLVQVEKFERLRDKDPVFYGELAEKFKQRAGIYFKAIDFKIYNIYRFLFVELGELISEREKAESGKAPTDSRKVVVVIHPRDDHNGAFAVTRGFMNLHKNGFRVLYYEVGSVKEMLLAMDTQKKDSVDVLIIGGHGSRSTIQFDIGEEDGSGDSPKLTLLHEESLKEISDRLKPRAMVIADGCRNGEGRAIGKNIANMLRRVFPQAKGIYTKEGPATSAVYEIDEETGEIKDIIIDTRYIASVTIREFMARCVSPVIAAIFTRSALTQSSAASAGVSPSDTSPASALKSEDVLYAVGSNFPLNEITRSQLIKEAIPAINEASPRAVVLNMGDKSKSPEAKKLRSVRRAMGDAYSKLSPEMKDRFDDCAINLTDIRQKGRYNRVYTRGDLDDEKDPHDYIYCMAAELDGRINIFIDRELFMKLPVGMLAKLVFARSVGIDQGITDEGAGIDIENELMDHVLKKFGKAQKLRSFIKYMLSKGKSDATNEEAYNKLVNMFIKIELVTSTLKIILLCGGALTALLIMFGVPASVVTGALFVVAIVAIFFGGVARETATLVYKIKYPETPMGAIFASAWLPHFVGFLISVPIQISLVIGRKGLWSSIKAVWTLRATVTEIFKALRYTTRSAESSQIIVDNIFIIADLVEAKNKQLKEENARLIAGGEKPITSGRPIIIQGTQSLDDRFEEYKRNAEKGQAYLFIGTAGGYARMVKHLSGVPNIYVFNLKECKEYLKYLELRPKKTEEKEADRSEKEAKRIEEEAEMSKGVIVPLDTFIGGERALVPAPAVAESVSPEGTSPNIEAGSWSRDVDYIRKWAAPVETVVSLAIGAVAVAMLSYFGFGDMASVVTGAAASGIFFLAAHIFANPDAIRAPPVIRLALGTVGVAAIFGFGAVYFGITAGVVLGFLAAKVLVDYHRSINEKYFTVSDAEREQNRRSKILTELIGVGSIKTHPLVYSPFIDKGDAVKFAFDVKEYAGKTASRVKNEGRGSMRILAIGVGTGLDAMTAFRAAKAEGLDVTLEGIDINEDAVDITRENFSAIFGDQPGVHIRKVDEKREFSKTGENFDLVIFNAPEPVPQSYNLQSHNVNENSFMDIDKFSALLEKVPSRLSDKGVFLLRGQHWLIAPSVNYRLDAAYRNMEMLPEGLEWDYKPTLGDLTEATFTRITFIGRRSAPDRSAKSGVWRNGLLMGMGTAAGMLLLSSHASANVVVDGLPPERAAALTTAIEASRMILTWQIQSDDPAVLKLSATANRIFNENGTRITVTIGDVNLLLSQKAKAQGETYLADMMPRGAARAAIFQKSPTDYLLVYDESMVKDGIAGLTAGFAHELVGHMSLTEAGIKDLSPLEEEALVFRLEIRYLEALLSDPDLLAKFQGSAMSIIRAIKEQIDGEKRRLSIIEGKIGSMAKVEKAEAAIVKGAPGGMPMWGRVTASVSVFLAVAVITWMLAMRMTKKKLASSIKKKSPGAKEIARAAKKKAVEVKKPSKGDRGIVPLKMIATAIAVIAGAYLPAYFGKEAVALLIIGAVFIDLILSFDGKKEAPSIATPSSPALPASSADIATNRCTDLVGEVYINQEGRLSPVTDIVLKVEGKKIFITGRDGSPLFDKKGQSIEFLEFAAAVRENTKMEILDRISGRLAGLSQAEATIVSRVVEHLRSQTIYYLMPNKHDIRGLSAGANVFLDTKLISDIGLFHAGAEDYLSLPGSPPIPDGLSAHEYLRGAETKARLSTRQPFLLGLQDRVFGVQENNKFSNDINDRGGAQYSVVLFDDLVLKRTRNDGALIIADDGQLYQSDARSFAKFYSSARKKLGNLLVPFVITPEFDIIQERVDLSAEAYLDDLSRSYRSGKDRDVIAEKVRIFTRKYLRLMKQIAERGGFPAGDIAKLSSLVIYKRADGDYDIKIADAGFFYNYSIQTSTRREMALRCMTDYRDTMEELFGADLANDFVDASGIESISMAEGGVERRYFNGMANVKLVNNIRLDYDHPAGEEFYEAWRAAFPAGIIAADPFEEMLIFTANSYDTVRRYIDLMSGAVPVEIKPLSRNGRQYGNFNMATNTISIDIDASKKAFAGIVDGLDDVRVTGFVHAHEIFHALVKHKNIALDKTPIMVGGVATDPEERLADIFAMKVMGLSPPADGEAYFASTITDKDIMKQSSTPYASDSGEFLLNLHEIGIDIMNIEKVDLSKPPAVAAMVPPSDTSPVLLAEEFKATFDAVPSKPDWLDEKIYGEIEKVFPALAKRTSAILSERQKKQFTGHNQIAYRKHEYEKNPLVTTYPLKVWQDAQEIVDSQGFDWNRLKYWVDLWGKCVWCSVNEWRDYNNVQYGPIVNIEFDGYGISKEQYEETKKQIEEFLKTELKDIQAGPGRYTAIRGFLFDLLCARFGVDIVGHTFDGWVALKNPRAIRKINLANRNPYAVANIDKPAAKPATGLAGGKLLGDGSVSSGTKKPSAAAPASAVTPPAGASVFPAGTSPNAPFDKEAQDEVRAVLSAINKGDDPQAVRDAEKLMLRLHLRDALRSEDAEAKSLAISLLASSAKIGSATAVRLIEALSEDLVSIISAPGDGQIKNLAAAAVIYGFMNGGESLAKPLESILRSGGRDMIVSSIKWIHGKFSKSEAQGLKRIMLDTEDEELQKELIRILSSHLKEITDDAEKDREAATVLRELIFELRNPHIRIEAIRALEYVPDEDARATIKLLHEEAIKEDGAPGRVNMPGDPGWAHETLKQAAIRAVINIMLRWQDFKDYYDYKMLDKALFGLMSGGVDCVLLADFISTIVRRRDTGGVVGLCAVGKNCNDESARIINDILRSPLGYNSKRDAIAYTGQLTLVITAYDRDMKKEATKSVLRSFKDTIANYPSTISRTGNVSLPNRLLPILKSYYFPIIKESLSASEDIQEIMCREVDSKVVCNLLGLYLRIQDAETKDKIGRTLKEFIALNGDRNALNEWLYGSDACEWNKGLKQGLIEAGYPPELWSADGITSVGEAVSSIKQKDGSVKTVRQEVRFEFRYDFFDDTYSGVDVPGCFNPLSGENPHMPLVYGLDAGVVFMNVYLQNRLIGNAVLILTDKGVVVLPLYTYHGELNLDEAVAQALGTLEGKFKPGSGISMRMSEGCPIFKSEHQFVVEEKASFSRPERVSEEAVHDFGNYDPEEGVTVFNADLSFRPDKVPAAAVISDIVKESARPKNIATAMTDARKDLLALKDDFPGYGFGDIDFNPLFRSLRQALFEYSEEDLDSAINDLKKRNGQPLSDFELAGVKEVLVASREIYAAVNPHGAQSATPSVAPVVTSPAGRRASPAGTSPAVPTVDLIAPRVVTYSDKNHGFSLQERRLTQAELLSGITPESISWIANPSQDLIERNREIILEIAQNNAVAEGSELSAKSIREVTEESLAFAIEELVRNAFDAYARVNTGSNSVDGPVRLRISKDSGNIIIEVSDNGIGFSRIVNEYDQLDVESNPAGTEYVLLQGGRQIGLRWVKVMAQLHGGRLEILSPGMDGFGTTIRIVVPENDIKINISDDELAMPAETVKEYAPLAPPEETPETADNFENNLRIGGQLAKALLEAGLKPEEAGLIVDEYFNTYIGSMTHAASLVKSLQGLLDIGLPSGIAKFFSSRNIWDKAQQGLILQAAKGHLIPSKQIVFQTNPYVISVALLLMIKGVGVTDPTFIGQGIQLILMTAAVLVATVIVAWGVIRLVQGILHWRETRNNAQTAEIMEAEKAMAEAQAEAIALRQAEEILASREALDDAYVEAGMIYRRYIAGRDTLVDNIQASDLSAGVKTELSELFHNGYAVLDSVLNTAPDIPDHLGDQKILTDALKSFSELDIIFNRVNTALETKGAEPLESPLEENDIKGINNRIAFEASRVAVLRDEYVNEPSLATEMADVLVPKKHRTLPDWKERQLQNGWSQLECQARTIEGGHLKTIFSVVFLIHDGGVLVDHIIDLRPDGERGNTGLILKQAIADVEEALRLEGPVNRVFVVGGMSYNWKLEDDGFKSLPIDDDGISKLDPALRKFLNEPDVKEKAFWYYPTPGVSEIPMPVVTPPSAPDSFFGYTRSYNRANYPEESFRFLAYSIGILGGDRIQEMDQAFYEFGRLNASNIITVEEMEALREGYLTLKDKIQEIRGIRPFIDPERGPDYEAEAKVMVEDAISGREGCLAATDAFILRLGSDARLTAALEVVIRFRSRMAEYFDELAARYAALATIVPAAIQTATQAPPIAPEAPIVLAPAAPAVVIPGNMDRPWQAGPLQAKEMDRARRIVTIAASFSHGTNEDTELMAPFGGAMVYCELLLPGLNVNDPEQAELAASMENFIGKADKLFAAHNDAIAMISPEESERARDIESMIYEDRGNIEAWFNAIEEAYKALIENTDIVGAILPKLENRISAEDYEMLGNILKYSFTAEEILSDRIKAVKGELSDELVDMNEIMRDLPYNLICTSHGDFGMERFRFEASAPNSPLFVRGNRRSLISMVSNLAANAFKYAGKNSETGADASITLGIRSENGRVIIAVSDDGVGMEPELAKRVLGDEFVTTAGTGIGTKEAKIIATNHGGSIDVISELGKGTTFIVNLPEFTAPTPAVPVAEMAARPVIEEKEGAGLGLPIETSPILAEEQVAVAKVVISELPQGTADIVVMPGSETYKSQQFALGKEIDRKLRKDYGQYTVPINYVFAADATARQAGIEQAVKQALSELIGKIKDGDKTARVMTYILPEDEQLMKDLLDGADFAEYKSRFTVVKEENIPQSGLIDEVMHIILAKGLLNYQRYENDEYGQGTRLSDQSKRQLADFIKTLIANPEAIDFDQDPGIINKILNGSINLRIRPIDFKEAQAWKKMQDAVLKSL